jgi:hypothetical protein
MNNLEKIKKAWSMGWSATLEYECDGDRMIAQIVSVLEHYNAPDNTCFEARYSTGIVSFLREEELVNYKITGYKYAGELAGNEPIPNKAIFKVKDIKWNKELVGKLVEYRGYNQANCRLQAVYGGKDYIFDKSEIEPIFE